MAEKEYIERGALIEKISEIKPSGVFTEALKELVLIIISDQPTADVQEVRHGKWRKVQNYALCTCCKHEVNWGNDDYLSPYCPNCGTKMDKE